MYPNEESIHLLDGFVQKETADAPKITPGLVFAEKVSSVVEIAMAEFNMGNVLLRAGNGKAPVATSASTSTSSTSTTSAAPTVGASLKPFQSGDKFKIWSNNDFTCSEMNCWVDMGLARLFGQFLTANCNQIEIKKGVEYGLNDLWFENGKKLGEGGFGQVYEADYHGSNIAFKKIPITIGNDRVKAIDEAFEEYNIMKSVSSKPYKGGTMVSDYHLSNIYKTGMENLIIKPLSYFYVENMLSNQLWIVICLPRARSDLERLKRSKKLSEDNIRSIMKQLNHAMDYLTNVRTICHRDLKPNNVLVNYDENNAITNIQVRF